LNRLPFHCSHPAVAILGFVPIFVIARFERAIQYPRLVIPAKAGIQQNSLKNFHWIPAWAGMTEPKQPQDAEREF
jgi:hypothetical protein